MVKQFTIPCQFGQETSPVTLYIGHPEPMHHPVKFQSDWLSSAKGGTIPQDLMDTLQKLHDLSMENGVDFEELCYYALISATEHSSGGVSPDDINKYADEFVKKEGDVETPKSADTSQDTQQTQQTNNSSTINAEQNNNNTTGEKNDIKEAEKVFNTNDVKTQEQQQTVNASNNSQSQNSTTNNTVSNTSNVSQNSIDDDILLTETYSQEDEDLLLDDDLSSF